MHRLIVDIGRVGLRDIEPIPLRISRKPEMLLLIPNKMLRTAQHAGTLNALNTLREHHTSKHRIRTEALPIPATLWRPTEWSSYGS